VSCLLTPVRQSMHNRIVNSSDSPAMLTCERVVHVLVEEFVARLGVSHMRGGVEAIQGCFMSEGDAQSISGGESKVPIGQLKVWVE
jgi:hypothetical protein